MSIVRRQDQNDEWQQITYMVYDSPLLDIKFSKRLRAIEKMLESNPDCKVVKLHKHVLCKSQRHLDQVMDKVIEKKGEGMMIKDPESKYEQKRSNYLLKVKKFDDAEATVIAIEKGAGRLSHLMGAIRVKNEKGIEFKIGSGFDDEQRAKPPKVGAVVTYKYQGLTKAGIPRFPIFMRLHPGI